MHGGRNLFIVSPAQQGDVLVAELLDRRRGRRHLEDLNVELVCAHIVVLLRRWDLRPMLHRADVLKKAKNIYI